MKDVDKRIEELVKRTKGDYITQACAFNKNSPRQMELLRFALQQSDSFSGLVKELLARMLDNGGLHHNGNHNFINQPQQIQQIYEQSKNKNIGNFL